MNTIDDRTISFIKEHHILTLATSSNNKPYCASCFYVYIEEKNIFVITSDFTTKHIKDVEKQNIVAGAIALETTMIGKIQGIQFTGVMKLLMGNDLKIANKAYINKFPLALLKDTTLWGIFPDFIKMTHNRLGFGKKLIWKK
ncbi:MAG: pyridoxamine 5'-phosphate oxidase family protein [Bacteroidales bacterium]|nr:pyridoxamine 5'-phosphate oxidase family protein [Bacteroidales bacterium]